MTSFADYDPAGTGAPVDVEVREAGLTDLDAVAQVQSAAGRPEHRDSWAGTIAAHDRCLLVALVSDRLVGWAQTHHHTDAQDDAPLGHYLGGVTVDPAWRRRGVAVALTEARLGWIAERADEAFYVVNPANRASIDLHERWGFSEVLRAPRLTGVDFTGGVGILMRAPLTTE